MPRGAQDHLDRRRPARQPRRLAPGWMARGAMANEPRPGREARAPSRRLAGRPGAAPSVASGDPRGQVEPRTPRPARGLQERQQLKKGCGGKPRAGFRDCSLPACVWSPDNPRGIIRSRALWSAGTRASVVALPRNAWERGFLEARALDVRSYVPLRPGIRPWAPPRPGWMARRARRGRQTPCSGWTIRAARRPPAPRRAHHASRSASCSIRPSGEALSTASRSHRSAPP